MNTKRLCIAIQKKYGFRLLIREKNTLPEIALVHFSVSSTSCCLAGTERGLGQQFDAAILLYFHTLPYPKTAFMCRDVCRLCCLLLSEDTCTGVGYYYKS